MDFSYKHLLPQDFHADSRVWVYQSSRMFALSEALQMEEILNHFTATWKSHGVDVKGFATLLFGQFIIIMADETATGVSGCSTDSSVRMIKQIEESFKVEMFNRQALAFVVKDKKMLHRLELLEKIDDDDRETILKVVDNYLTTAQLQTTTKKLKQKA